jgi:hypothetical protein
MTKPNFQTMTRKEILDYIVEHRDDDEAFYAFMDKVYAEPPRQFYPAPKTIDDLRNFPELLERFRQNHEQES